MKIQKKWTYCITLSFLSLLVVHGDQNAAESQIRRETDSVRISVTIPDDTAFPSKEILERLLSASHTELLASGCYTSMTDHAYPQVVFLTNSVTKTFAVVWLPPDWEELPAAQKRVIVHLHGHCGLGTKHFCTWFSLAQRTHMGVIALQYWMGDDDWLSGNPPPNPTYRLYREKGGGTCGWHLHEEDDMFPGIDALLKYYGATSAMLHGFSVAAASSIMISYLDKQQQNRIDFVVFNAGHLAPNHQFRREIEHSQNLTAFAGERFLFFLEKMNPSVYANQEKTRMFVLDYGGQEIDTVVADQKRYRHGALLNHQDFAPLREKIVDLYDSLTTE